MGTGLWDPEGDLKKKDAAFSFLRPGDQLAGRKFEPQARREALMREAEAGHLEGAGMGAAEPAALNERKDPTEQRRCKRRGEALVRGGECESCAGPEVAGSRPGPRCSLQAASGSHSRFLNHPGARSGSGSLSGRPQSDPIRLHPTPSRPLDSPRQTHRVLGISSSMAVAAAPPVQLPSFLPSPSLPSPTRLHG